ncbi:MAG: SDR family NAD(P)-dependent oxidoreductase [Bdellovibrionales bacterium]
MYGLVDWFRRRTPPTYRPVILVTGCSSGIGAALADLLHSKAQYRVVVTARANSLRPLQEKFGDDERFWVRPLDVTSPGDRQRLLSEIKRRWGGVDILINNAGISYRSVVEHMSPEDEHRQMAVNYFGPLELIRMVLPFMREKGRGKIINVSSVSGMLAMPTMASYSASKHALEGVSEALWYEMRPLGINVSLIQPGFINSNSFKKVYYSEASRQALKEGGPYSDYYEHMSPFIERLMRWSLSSPESVARVILRVIRRQHPALWIPATPDALIFYYLRRLFPRSLLLPILFAALPKTSEWAKKYTRRRVS